MDQAIEARKSINKDIEPAKISFNDLVVKAAAISLKEHPQVNSSWMGDFIRYNDHVHIGVAVAVPDGLLVPVVRFADGKTLTQIGAEVKEMAGKAKDKKLQPEDWEGNTFTISNLGMFGIEEFTAIINPPDACILAVGGIVEKPVVKNGQIVPGNTMKVTLSCDHRVVDGVVGSAFLNTFKDFVENGLFKDDFKDFSIPNNIYLTSINYDTGLKSTSKDKNTIIEALKLRDINKINNNESI